MNWKSKTSSLYSSLKRRDPTSIERWKDLTAFRNWLAGEAIVWRDDEEEWWECYYCPRQFQYPNISLDHRIARDFGGTARDVVIACHACNVMKGTLPEYKFRELLAWIETLPDEKPPNKPRGRSVREQFEWRLRSPFYRFR